MKLTGAHLTPTRILLLGVLVAAAAAFAVWRADTFRLVAAPWQSSFANLQLTDFDGRQRSLADYRGQVVVLFFGFTNCPDACPTEFFKLSQVVKRLGPAADKVQVLFVTLDPERDTPGILRSYVTAFDPRFVALTGTTQQIYAVTRSFDVMHVKLPMGNDYTIDHSLATHVIDAQQQHRFIASPDVSVGDLVHDLKLLLRR